MCLNTMEKIDKGEDKKHAGKLTTQKKLAAVFLSDKVHIVQE